MPSIVKTLLKKVFPKSALHYKAYKALIKNENSFLYLTGWMRSLEKAKPVDKDGNQTPWMNYHVIEFLKDRLKSDLNLFEFGSGYSTTFYARLVQTVTSVEYEKSWLQLVKETAPNNVKLIYKEKDIDGGYCRAIIATGQLYDVVVIDGRDRVNCIKQSIKTLSERGVVLLDDSQRDRYQECIAYAKANGFRAIDFEGFRAPKSGIDRTTIFYRNANCLKI